MTMVHKFIMIILSFDYSSEKDIHGLQCGSSKSRSSGYNGESLCSLENESLMKNKLLGQV